MGSKAILVHGTISAGVIYFSPADSLGRTKPVKHFANRHRFLAAQKHMPVVGHEAKSKKIDGVFGERFSQGFYHLSVIEFIEKHLRLLCGTITDVNNLTRGTFSRFSWHIRFNW